MSVDLVDFMGDRDGIRWGHATSPDAPTPSHRFMWTYDAIGDRARVFISSVGQDEIAREFRGPQLAAEVRRLVRQRLELPA